MPTDLDELIDAAPLAGAPAGERDPLDSLLDGVPAARPTMADGQPVPRVRPPGLPAGLAGKPETPEPFHLPAKAGAPFQLGKMSQPDDYDMAPVVKGAVRNTADFLAATGPMIQNNPDLGGKVGAPPPTFEGNPQTMEPSQVQQFSDATNTPLVPLSVGSKPGTLTHGLLRGAESLTTPQNAGIVLATGGLGTVINTALTPVLGAAANTALAGYFAANMGKDAGEGVKQAYDAYKKGDMQGMAEALGYTTVSAALAGLGAWHTGKSLSGFHREMGEAINRHNENAAAATFADAAQHYGEQPPPEDFASPAAPNTGAPKGKQPVNRTPGAPPHTPGSSPDEPLTPTKPTNVERVSQATPDAPTASQPTTPEAPETIALQLDQLAKGQRKVVMFPKGTPPPATYPPGTAVTNDGLGNIYVYRNDLINRGEIKRAARNNTLHELLGSTGMGMGTVDKSELQGDPITVVGRAPDGTEAQSTATDAAHLQDTLAATHAVTPQGGTVSIEPPEQVISDRQGVPPVAQPSEDLGSPQSLESPVTPASPVNQPPAADLDSVIDAAPPAGAGSPNDAEQQTAVVEGFTRSAAPKLHQLEDWFLKESENNHPLVLAEVRKLLKPAREYLEKLTGASDWERDLLQHIVKHGEKLLAHPERAANKTPDPNDIVRPDGVRIFAVPNPDDGGHITVAAHPDFKDGNVPAGGDRVAVDAELRRRGLTGKNVLGAADFVPTENGNGHYYSVSSYISPDWQRKGIGTQMYDLAEKVSGKQIEPSSLQSDEAKAFTESRKARREGATRQEAAAPKPSQDLVAPASVEESAASSDTKEEPQPVKDANPSAFSLKPLKQEWPTYDSYDVVDPQGNRVGSLTVGTKSKDAPKDSKVLDLSFQTDQTSPNQTGEQTEAGPRIAVPTSAIRNIVQEIAERYPNADLIQSSRQTGIRGRNGNGAKFPSLIDLRAVRGQAKANEEATEPTREDLSSPASIEAPAATKSYKYELRIQGEGEKWHPNAVAFATREEAEKAGQSKFQNWMMATDKRVVESDETPNYRWDDKDGLQPIEEKPAEQPQLKTAQVGDVVRRGEIEKNGAYFSKANSWSTYSTDDDGEPLEGQKQYNLSGAKILNGDDWKTVAALATETLKDPDLTSAERKRLETLSTQDHAELGLHYTDLDELPMAAAGKRLGYDGALVYENDDLTGKPSSVFLWNVEHAKEEEDPQNAEAPTKHEFASTQVNLPGAISFGLRSYGKSIPDDKLAEDGRETEPHITVKYGLHGNDPADVARVLANEPPITVTLGKTSLFSNEDADVLKVEVDSPDLHRLNKKIADALPHTDTHPEYQPHATIAYLKPGQGDPYSGKRIAGITGKSVTIDRITFSGKNGEQVDIPLSGSSTAEDLGSPASLEPPTTPVDKPSTQVEDLARPAATEGIDSLVNAIYQKLKAGQSLGNVTELNRLAEQHLGASRTSGEWTPKDVFDAMEAGINKYLIDEGNRLLHLDGIEGLKQLRELMSRVTTQGTRTDEQIKHQQFSTPPTESYVAAKVAALKSSDVVFEPSAGNGGLAVWPKSIGAEIHVNEIAPRRQQMLEAVGFGKPTAHDGEIVHALLDPAIKPTVILMNPPFSAGTVKSHEARNRNVYGFNHVDSALQRLAPGGRLVAILGGGQANEPEGGASLFSKGSGKWFEGIAKRYNVRANIRINGKEYAKYGTSFATRIIVIDKTGPTPYTVGASRWENVVKANVDTLEQAYELLRPIAESRPTADVSTRPGRQAGDRQSQSGTGLGASQDHGSAGDSAVSPGERSPSAEGQFPGGSGELNGGPRGNEPDTRSEPTPLREREPSADQDPEAAADGSTPSSTEVPDGQRPLSGTGTVEPDHLDLGQTERDINDQHEKEDSEAYVEYRPSLKGPDHPGDIVETKTMATVPMPPITYKPNLPASVLEGARLSAVQLEAISIAGQQNEIVLPGGARASALVGDGTGVGKGRIAAGILWDNYRQGRKRLVFVSEKWDLIQDAMDAFDGIGAEELMRGIKREGGKWVAGPNAGILPMKKYNVKADIKHDGVLFTTYPLVRSGDKKGNRRVAQLERYLRGDDDGEGAYIIYDESHNLKNAIAAQRGEVSQIGTAVKELMERMPKLRTTSLSATAATDVVNLGYLDRLGLWGPGTPFPNGFREFSSQVASGGMAAMELIARELKAQGKYVSRTLSFKGVTYSEEEHHLTPEQKELYRTAARAWSSVIQRAEGTIRNTTNGGRAARSNFMSQLGGAQQRFFNVLITTLKIPTAIELANKALADNKAVVITLVNTNEAAQNREKNKAKNLDESEDEELLEYDFGPKEMLVDLVRNHYPVQQYKDDVDPSGNPIKTPVYRPGPDGEEIPVLNPEAVAQRDALIAEINRDLHLPENPLDALINGLGGHKKVAELTGRTEYFDRTQDKFVFRGDPNVSRKDVNIMEMRNFQSGKKKVAVLSSAAGTGISLHASNRAENQRRRYQICLQVGWSADKQMQMFGRTHRTDQASAPEYVMLVSDLGGEKRFVSTIARRLGSLGALTKGQKNATSGSDLMEKVNFETDQGRQATNSFYTALLEDGPVPGTGMTGMEILTALRILEADGNISRANRTNVTRLLNRMLALDPDVQNAAYNYFYEIFQSIVQAAIENNSLDTGVRSLPGDEFTVKPQRVIATDPATGATTHYQPVDAKVRMERLSPTELKRRLKAYKDQKARLITGGDGDKLILAMDASPIVHADGRLEAASYIARPGNGKWQKVSNSQLSKALPVSEWAEEKLHAAERDLKQTERDLTWRRKDLNEQTVYERERQQRTHGSRITQLESRLSYQDAGEARTRTEQELATARKAYAEAQTFEFEPDHYQRSAVTSLEEKLVKDQAAVEKAKPIAQDPQQWALDRWGEQYEAAPSHTVQEHHFITGAVMRYWNPIKESTAIRNSIFTATDSKTGKRIVGISIPDNRIGNLLSRIEGGGSTVNADQLYSDVLRNNLTYELETGIQVMQGRIGRTPVIQMIPSSRQVGDQLVALGLKYERGITPIYYVPNAAAGTAGVHNILTKVLKEFPVKPEEGTKKDEGGAEPTYVTLGSGLGGLQDPLAALYRKDIVPAAKAISSRLRGALDDIRKGFAPQTRGEPARKGYGLIREMNAEIDQRRDRAVAALKAYRSHFYAMPKEHGVHGLDVYDAIETGQTHGLSPVDQAFAGIVRKLFDGRYQELQALGRLNTYIQDYLPHEYKNPDDATRWIQNWQSKRPMAGSEAFRKRRVYPTMREALEDPNFTLEAKFDNPVDFVLSKLGQMDKSITAHLIFEELEDEGRLQYVPAGGKVPAGMAAIDDKIFTVFGPKRGTVKIDPIDPDKQEAKPEAQDFATPAEFKDALRDWKATTIQPEDVRVFGKREMGRYYAAEPLARVINNHLSPGISFLDAYKIWRDVNNTLNMVSLSSSWYHGLTTTLNSSFSDMALGMKQALAGKPVEGATSVARGFVPFASIVSDFFKGTVIQKVWDGEMAAPDVLTAAIVDALKQGGGKARQDMYYATSYTEGISKAWNQPDNPIGAAWGATWRLPFAAMELTMKPIMEYLVPRAKLGAFAKRAQLEIEQNPTMGLDEAREKFGKIWDAMDDRFGQLSQRNLMMNAIVKDLMNAVVGRPGWNIGSVRALGGGLYDGLKMLGDSARGKRPEFSDRTAFLIAMLLGGAVLSGMVSWLLSGKKPDELMDYVMPRDGGVTEDGRPSRIVLPTYVAKDLYSYLTRPVATLKAKASPALTIASDLLSNRNFYGQKIHGRGGVGVANYLKSAATPYSVQGLQKNLERGESPAKTVLPFVGIMPAGKRVGLSKAEQIITEYRDEQRANTPPAPTAHSRARSQVFQAAKSGDMAKAHRLGNEAIKEGTLTQHDVLHAIQRGKESPLINDVKTLPFNVALEVFDAATPAERKQIEPLVRKKVFAARTKSPSEWDNDTRTLAAKWFRVRMRQPTASGDFATPSAIQ